MQNSNSLFFGDDPISYETMMLNSFVISFNDQKLDIMYEFFKKENIIYFPKKYEAFHGKNVSGPYNCSLSHAGIIKMAKAINLPFVCIFEDDAYPCKNFNEKIKACIKQIPKDANIVMLGYSGNRAKTQFKSDQLVKTPEYTYGSHSYIIFACGYDEYLKRYADTACNKNVNADGLLWRMSHSYYVGNPLFIQYSGNISMNGHSGYIFFGNKKTPPSGFEPIKSYELINYNKLSNLITTKYILKYPEIVDLAAKHKICHIIGTNSHNQICECIENACTIRCATQSIDIQKFQADLYFSYESMQNKIKKEINSVFIKHVDILELSQFIYKNNITRLSTLFVVILISLNVFEKVYVHDLLFTVGKNRNPEFEMSIIKHISEMENSKLLIQA